MDDLKGVSKKKVERMPENETYMYVYVGNR